MPSIIQSFPPLSTIQVCIPAEVGKVTGGAGVSCRVIVPDDQDRGLRAYHRSNGGRAALERRGRLLRWNRLWRISRQGLDGSGQQEAFQLCRLLALPSESESTPGGGGGRPGHSAVTGIVPGNLFGRIEDVGDEAGRLDTNSPAELHTLLEATENGSGENVLGTLLPGGNGATRLALRAEDQPNEHVQTPEGEEEEGGDEREAADMVGKDRGPKPVVIQGRIRTTIQLCVDKGRPDSQALNDAESPDAEAVSKDGEEPIKEGRGPTDFGKEEDYDLSNDQKTVEDGPEDAGRLVGNGRIPMNRVRKDAHGPSRETYGT